MHYIALVQLIPGSTGLPDSSYLVSQQRLAPLLAENRPTAHLLLLTVAVRFVAVKIAIPTFGSRVSPRFDCAETILVVALRGGEPSERQELNASGLPPHERIRMLLELGVDTVVCGGIDCRSIESLQRSGVTLYGWVAGEIDDALAALLRGDLDSDAPAEARGRFRCRRFAGHAGLGNPGPGAARGNQEPGAGRGMGRGTGRGRGRGGGGGGGGGGGRGGGRGQGPRGGPVGGGPGGPPKP